MAHRLALALLLAALALPPACRALAARPAPPRACRPEGRGALPRHWLGCAADPGPARALADEERLILGRPLLLNAASARALAFVPGLSRHLGEAVVADRAARGPFGSVEELARVQGIGPRRLTRARASLEVAPP